MLAQVSGVALLLNANADGPGPVTFINANGVRNIQAVATVWSGSVYLQTSIDGVTNWTTLTYPNIVNPNPFVGDLELDDGGDLELDDEGVLSLDSSPFIPIQILYNTSFTIGQLNAGQFIRALLTDSLGAAEGVTVYLY